MGILTKNDIELVQQEVERIDYGTVELEFKRGMCVSITHKGRILTEKGMNALNSRKNKA